MWEFKSSLTGEVTHLVFPNFHIKRHISSLVTDMFSPSSFTFSYYGSLSSRSLQKISWLFENVADMRDIVLLCSLSRKLLQTFFCTLSGGFICGVPMAQHSCGRLLGSSISQGLSYTFFACTCLGRFCATVRLGQRHFSICCRTSD